MDEPSCCLKEIMRDSAATNEAIGLREDDAILAPGGEERGDIRIIDELDTSSFELDRLIIDPSLPLWHWLTTHRDDTKIDRHFLMMDHIGW